MEGLRVEDCAGDALLTSQILAESPIPVKLHIARDGLQAIMMLGGRTFKPDLVILDLNIPEISGHAVLARYHPKEVPVIVFSASRNEGDREQALALGAREYIQKPLDIQAFRDAVCGIIERWVVRKQGGAASRAATS